MSRPSAAVLISGGGTNLQAFIDRKAAGELGLELSVVVSNRPEAYGLERARQAGIAVECLPHGDYPDRDAFDAALGKVLEKYAPDLIVLAGFMRILTAPFVQRFRGRVLNIHPSLLPRHPGLNTHQRAIDAGDRWHGSTVHFVTEELDGGPPIIQGRVAVVPGESALELAARVLDVEHRIYPEAARLFAAGRIELRDGCAWLDGEKLTRPLQWDGADAAPE